MQGMYSMRSPAVKRLVKEAQELREPTEQYACQPLDENLFEWHFTIRGPADSEFDGGLYHGRIILPPEYPMKPPSIIILTPNGRFEINKKICLSISGHHPESWQPSWSLRTAILAIIGFMPTHGDGALGSLNYSSDERKILAKRSQDFKCPECGCINNILKPVTEQSKKDTEEAKELAAQISFKDEKEKNAALKSASAEAVSGAAVDTPGVEDETPDDASSATASPASAPHFPSTCPPQFGQFPFGMPFPPPFPPMHADGTGPQDARNAALQMPRFPLPSMAAFYPRMPFPPMMMSPGGFPVPPPMMPGMQMPPWQPQQNLMTSAQSPQNVMSSSSAQIPSPSNRESSEISRETTENAQSTNPSASEPPTSTQSQEQEETLHSQQESSNATAPETETMASRQQESLSEGLRQRTVPRSESVGFASVQRENRHAHLPTHSSSLAGDFALMVFATFIIGIIFLLLLRRLKMMNLLSSLF